MNRIAALLPLAFALLFAACGQKAPWPEPPSASIDVRASLSRDQVPLLGDVDLVLDVWHRADLDVEFDPAVPAGFTGKVAIEPVRDFGKGRWRRALLHLRPVQGLGVQTIAPFLVKATDGSLTATSPELKVEVTSLLADAGHEVEAPAPLLAPPVRLWPWFAGAGALAALAAATVWWMRRPRKAPKHADAVALPPHSKALRELMRLRGVPRRTPAEVDAFYVGTSQVLRVYLEERFGLHAPERTTEEFLHEIETGGPLSAAQCLEVRRFLLQCDLVKFAAQQPAEEVHLQTLAIAELLVEATRGDRVEPRVEAVA